MRRIWKLFKGLNGALEWVSRQLGWIAGGLTVVMMIAIVREVVGRYFFHSPSDWSLELSEYLLVALAYLAAAYTEVVDGHIRIDFLYDRFKGRPKAVLDILIRAVGLFWGWILVWEGGRIAFHSLQTGARSSEAMMWPLFPSQIMIPLGTALLLLVLIARMIKSIGDLIKGEE
jgi:C4-dicarboxylate transporter DctQ subunit